MTESELISAKKICLDELAPGDYAASPWGTYEYLFVLVKIHHFKKVGGTRTEAHHG